MFRNCRIVARGVDPAEYQFAPQPKRGDPAYVVSSSTMRKFGHCPWAWQQGKEQPRTFSLDYGNLFETVLLMPDALQTRFIIRPDTYTTTGMKCPQCGSVTDSAKCKDCKRDRVKIEVEKDWTGQSKTCQAMEEEWAKAGKVVIEKDGNDKFPGLNQAQDAAAVIRANTLARAFIDACNYQVHVAGEWTDKATGLVIPVQALIDLEPNEEWCKQSLGDIKTTRGGYAPFFEADVRSRAYHIQGAWNLDLYNAATGEKRDRFVLLTSDNTHPWTPGTYFLSEASLDEADQGPGFIDYGRVTYQAWMAEYAQSLKTGRWRAYTDGWQEIRPNPYKDGPAQDRALANAPAPQPLPRDDEPDPEPQEQLIP